MRCDDSQRRELLERVEAKIDAIHFLLTVHDHAPAGVHDHPLRDVEILVEPPSPPRFRSVHFDAMQDMIITFPCQQELKPLPQKYFDTFVNVDPDASDTLEPAAGSDQSQHCNTLNDASASAGKLEPSEYTPARPFMVIRACETSVITHNAVIGASEEEPAAFLDAAASDAASCAAPTVPYAAVPDDTGQAKGPIAITVKSGLESFFATHERSKHWSEIYRLVDAHRGHELKLVLGIADKYEANEELSSLLYFLRGGPCP